MRRVITWWREWRGAREEYRAAADEMQFHIEQETEHNIRNGMSPEAARRAALTAFGGVDRFAEAAHDERPGTKWSDFRMSHLDWKLGGRMLVKYPGMSIISGITLAAAIGLGAGWFEMTMMLFRPELPLEDGERIVRIEYWDPATLDPEQRTMHEFVQWREDLASIEQIGAHRTVRRNLAVPGRAPQEVPVAEISAAAFDVTRVTPLLGRPLIAADEEPGGGDVLVIGYSAWQRHFDGDRTVVGRQVQVGRNVVTIVGVMPEGYRFPSTHQFWMPLRAVHAEPLEGGPIEVFGRLRAGATMEAAQAELRAWNARMAQASPATHSNLRLNALPFATSGEATLRQEVFLVNLFAWLILAVACANVAALMFARTALRESEIVVRNALGASRARVMGQLFTEALVLTCVSAAAGLLAAKLVMGYVIRLSADRAPFWWESNIEPLTIFYTAGLALAGAAMVGLLPALRATGSQVRAGLAQIGSAGTSMRFGGAWSVIIVFQVAFSVVCLPFGIAAASEAYHKSGLRAAYPADRFLTFLPTLDVDVDAGAGDSAPDGERSAPSTIGAAAGAPDGHAADAAADDRHAILAELAERLGQEPEAAAIALASHLPGSYHPLRRIEAQRGGEPPFAVDANTEGNLVRVGAVSPGFFDTFEIPLLAGRDFSQADVSGAHGVVVINAALARNIGGNAIGTRIRVAASGDNEPGPWLEVIGVTRNFGLTPTGAGEADYMYTPASPDDVRYMVLRVNGGASAFAPRLRTLAMQVDPMLRLQNVLSLRDVIRREDQPMIHATLTGLGVVLLAVLLSAASLYALMSVAVALRTREVGIRLAIGASSRAVLMSLFRRAATQVGVGILAGNIVVALLLFVVVEEVRAAFVLPPMLGASVVMLLVGGAACLVPARRALRIQPTAALKETR